MVVILKECGLVWCRGLRLCRPVCVWRFQQHTRSLIWSRAQLPFAAPPLPFSRRAGSFEHIACTSKV